MRDDQVKNLLDEAKRLRYSRRSVLKRATALGLSTAAVGAAFDRSVGAAPVRKAPAFLQGTSLNILASTYFVPAAQDFYTQQAEQWGEENNVSVTVDYSNWPDLQPRVASAVESGSGPDVVEMLDGWPFLYVNAMVEVNDLVSRVSENLGEAFPWVEPSASVDGQYHSVPVGTTNNAMLYRVSLLEEAGWDDPANNPPDTWEDFFEIGRALKEMGKPIGQALGHSTGDPPAFAYSYMWAHGAMELDEDGNIAYNTPEFVEGMEAFLSAWNEAFDDTGLGWDDAVNNRAYLADQIGMTFNGSSVYLTALNEAPEIAEDTATAIFPQGPAGRFNSLGSRSYAAMSYSNNQEGALDFLEWWYQPENFQAWLEAFEGYLIPAWTGMADLPVFSDDPKLLPFSRISEFGRNIGYSGPANRQAAQVSSQYIVVDTFANAVESGDAAGSIEQAALQMERIYSR